MGFLAYNWTTIVIILAVILLIVIVITGYKKAPPDFFRICLYEEREAGQLYRRLKGIGSFLTAQGEKDNMTAVLIGYEKEESVWKKNEKSVKNTF